MASQSSRTPSPRLGIRDRNSPPPSPPSPNPGETETKLGKREREVSLEPVTTPKALNDSDPLANRETRTTAKRIQLDPTLEEEDTGDGSRSRSNSVSPPLGVSPPYEMKIKVRQISQGVEDLSWRNLSAPDSQLQVTAETETDTLEPAAVITDDIGMPQQPTVDQPEITLDQQPDHDIQVESVPPQLAASDEKGLKRTFLQRGTSEGPPETDKSASEPLKRQRDDDDKDDNPRETKRPSPPPSEQAPKPAGGFMAYASATSPFASVKGQNVFAARKASSPAPSTPLSEVSTTAQPALSHQSSLSSIPSGASSPKPQKRSGFDAFASSTSPFASIARAKSPVLGSASKWGRSRSPTRRNHAGATAASNVNSNAFTAYAGENLHGFALPPSKKIRSDSPGLDKNPVDADSGAEDGVDEEKEMTFSEKLRAAKDDENGIDGDDDRPKIHLTEQEVTTGEEEEETIHQVRGKLFSLSDGAWKERGTGLLKLNVRASDGGGARLVMRKEAVYTLLLNVTLFRGMSCALAQDPRYLRLSVIENGTTTHYNLKVANAKIAQELKEEIQNNLP